MLHIRGGSRGGADRTASRGARSRRVCRDGRDGRMVLGCRGGRRRFWLLGVVWRWMWRCVVVGANSIATTAEEVPSEGMGIVEVDGQGDNVED